MKKPFDAIAYVDTMAAAALPALIATLEGVESYKQVAVECYDYAYAMLDEKLRRANPPVENPKPISVESHVRKAEIAAAGRGKPRRR